MALRDWPDFIGSAYVSTSAYAAVERCENLYLEAIEVPEEKKTRKVLYPRPACGAFGTSPSLFPTRCRGLLAFGGTVYGVNGSVFYSVSASGVQKNLGTVIDDGNPVTMCANSQATAGGGQVAIASGGQLYIYNAGSFAQIPLSGDFFGAASVTFLDGYFIVLTPKSSQFQISALNDGTTWSGADVAILEGQADGIQNLIADKEYLYLIGGGGGGGRTELWYNSGNVLFPFSIESGAFMELGIGPVYSLCQGDPERSTNAAFWVGQSARGGLSAWKVVGLTPQRISTHPIEQEWASYSSTADCISYTFLWRGHMFVRYIFPTAQKKLSNGNLGTRVGYGWQYDATASADLGYPSWSTYNFTDANGAQWAPLERAHCYQYGLHIVGSGGQEGAPGVLYQLTDPKTTLPYYDAGSFPILRRRTCPHLFNSNKRDIYNLLDIGMEVGVGLDSGVQGSNPQVMAQMSGDGGNTFGTQRQMSLGQIGQYQTLLRFRRWGYARDCVYDIQVSDPVFSAITNAEIDVTPGNS